MIDFYSTRAEGKQAPKLVTHLKNGQASGSGVCGIERKWLNNLLGGTLDTGNQAVVTYITGLDEKAGEYWSSMIKSDDASRTNLWSDLDMSYIAGTGAKAKVHSGNVAQTFYRLKDMAIAWATEAAHCIKTMN